MRISRRINKATDTEPEYVMCIAFPHQKYLRERTSVLHYSTLPPVFLRRFYPVFKESQSTRQNTFVVEEATAQIGLWIQTEELGKSTDVCSMSRTLIIFSCVSIVSKIIQ